MYGDLEMYLLKSVLIDQTWRRQSEKQATLLSLLFIGLVLTVTGLLATSAVTALAQEVSELSHITIEITAEGVASPHNVPEGAVYFTFEND